MHADDSSITLDPNGPSSLGGERESFIRPNQMFSMLEPIAQYLDKEVTIYASDHDMGNSVIHDDLRAAALEAAAKGTYISTEELERLEDGRDHGLGMFASCSETSPARVNQWPHKTDGKYAWCLCVAVVTMSFADIRIRICLRPEPAHELLPALGPHKAARRIHLADAPGVQDAPSVPAVQAVAEPRVPPHSFGGIPQRLERGRTQGNLAVE